MCAGNELDFNGRILCDPEEIFEAWGSFFEDLYSYSNCEYFDPMFQNIVDTRIADIMHELSSPSDRDSVNFTDAVIRKVLNQLKTNKACGRDGIYNKHLKHGGVILVRELTILCNEMYNHGYVPDSLKPGVFITLHKGGRKSKKDPNNYRAITLTSSILKVFERLALPLLENSLEMPLNKLQGGFRPMTGCNMSSVMLKECILYAKEHDSKLYACFLDAQKAFDRVWHNGLFLKLYNMGIRSKLLGIVIDLHHNLTSCVLHKGYHSTSFPV